MLLTIRVVNQIICSGQVGPPGTVLFFGPLSPVSLCVSAIRDEIFPVCVATCRSVWVVCGFQLSTKLVVPFMIRIIDLLIICSVKVTIIFTTKTLRGVLGSKIKWFSLAFTQGWWYSRICLDIEIELLMILS